MLVIFFCILFFVLILFLGSLTFSFYFSRSGRELNYRDFYECGFKAVSDNKSLIEINFSVIGLIFLVYEIEIILFVPLFLNLFNLTYFFLFFSIFSLLVIGLSYFFEWDRYSLDWVM